MYTQQSGVRANSKVQLTSAGEDLVENGRLDGTTSGEILIYIHDNGASRVFSIADGVNLDDGAALSAIKKLINSGYLEETEEERQPSTGNLEELD